MATSGEYFFDPDMADMVEEAFERAKVDPSTLSPQHAISARRSIDFMLVEWATDDFPAYRIDRINDFPLVQGQEEYVLDPDTDGRIIDVIQVSVRRQGVDTGLYSMTRQELLDIPDKFTQGRPNRYFADKRQNQILLTLWAVPENSTDTLLLDVVRKPQDSGAAALTPDIQYYMREAFCSGLAARVNVKYGKDERQTYLDNQADKQYKSAKAAVNTLGDVAIIPASNHRRRMGGRIR